MLIPESASSCHDRAEEGCGNTNTTVRKLHDSKKTSQHATRDPTLETRSHPWVPAGHPQYTGTHQDGKAVGWPNTTTTYKKTTAHSNMVAEHSVDVRPV